MRTPPDGSCWVKAVRAGLILLCGAAVFIRFSDEPRLFADDTDPRPVTGSARDAQTLTAKIDYIVSTHWNAERVESAPLADDAEFLRRVYLDLAGKIPPVSEVRQFLDDPASDKRPRLVERLLNSPAYVTHFGHFWRAAWLGDASSNMQLQFLVPGFEAWLKKRLSDGTPYDKLTREIITTKFSNNDPGFNPYQPAANPTPIAFYYANELRPENLAASTSRLFLAVKLECAQCHNHPFASWTRDQFWSYAAFFSGMQRQGQGGVLGAFQEVLGRKGLAIPGTDRIALPRFLDDQEPPRKPGVTSRELLADWMTAPDNPLFARAAVNRLWANFFGIGLVDPIDDLSSGNESNPKLLEELAHDFATHGFDFKYFIRGVTASQVYQLSSLATHLSQDTSTLPARMPIRGLSPEQLFDSLMQATGFQEFGPGSAPFNPFNASPLRTEFLSKFAQQEDRRTETQTTILQALSIMNGRLISDATSLDRSETLAAVADAPFMDTAAKIETLYLATLTRRPQPAESEMLVNYVNAGGPGRNPKTALADVFWALLNSGEFLLNH